MHNRFIVDFEVSTKLQGKGRVDVMVEAPNQIAAIPAAREKLANSVRGKVAARSAVVKNVELWATR